MTEQEFLKIKKYIHNEIYLAIKKFILFSSDDYKHNIETIIDKLKTFVKPKTEFKVGDRVATYSSNGTGNFLQRGKIRTINEGWYLIVDLDNGYSQGFHKKQCRRLKKKL